MASGSGGTSLLPAKNAASSSTSQPHIVMVLADDVGWNQVGYQSSHSKMSTPRIDALALAGVRLERMYSHFICAPSRAALQSGRSSHLVHLQKIRCRDTDE